MTSTFDIKLRYNNTESVAPSSQKMTFYEELYVDVQRESFTAGQRIQIVIHPKTDVVINELMIQLPYNFRPTDKLFCNGFQSQSESLEYHPDDRIAPLKPFAASKWNKVGHYGHPLLKDKRANLYSWTYGYIKRENKYLLIGSLSEKTGFTIIRYFCKEDVININLDAQKLKLSHSFPAMDIVLLDGSEQEVFDQYFQLMEIPNQGTPPLRTCLAGSLPLSNAAILNKDIELLHFEEAYIPIDCILINKGYPMAIGDWVTEQSNFPKGISSAPSAIHQAGCKAGIWLAPFVCSASSNLYKNKKQWLLKDQKGKPIKVPDRKATGGAYYVLDYYDKSVTDYLISVFHKITKQWSYDLVCLDLLHAVCLEPPSYKTKGQVMCEAADFLRKQCESLLIIGASIPLGASFGRVDYCYTANHNLNSWENNWLRWNHVRERNTVVPAMQSQLNRRQLIGRAFLPAPNIVVLDDSHQSFTIEQQETFLLINSLTGVGLILSENSSSYSPEQVSEINQALLDQQVQLTRTEQLSPLLYQINFIQNNKKRVAYINLSGKKKTIQRKGKGQTFDLDEFESMVLKGG